MFERVIGGQANSAAHHWICPLKVSPEGPPGVTCTPNIVQHMSCTRNSAAALLLCKTPAFQLMTDAHHCATMQIEVALRIGF